MGEQTVCVFGCLFKLSEKLILLLDKKQEPNPLVFYCDFLSSKESKVSSYSLEKETGKGINGLALAHTYTCIYMYIKVRETVMPASRLLILPFPSAKFFLAPH